MAAPLGKDASLSCEPSAISATVSPEPAGRNAGCHPPLRAPLGSTMVPATLPSNILTVKGSEQNKGAQGAKWVGNERRGGGGGGSMERKKV